jgi:hypothetical protein
MLGIAMQTDLEYTLPILLNDRQDIGVLLLSKTHRTFIDSESTNSLLLGDFFESSSEHDSIEVESSQKSKKPYSSDMPVLISIRAFSFFGTALLIKVED